MDGGDRAASRIVPSADDVWGEAELVLKVKEPQAPEVSLLRPEVTLFTYLHLAPAPDLTKGLAEAAMRDPGLKLGINVARGKVTHPAVAEGVGMEYASPEEVLGFDSATRDAGSDGAGATATKAVPGAH
jgi:alanine dehydrogenase